MTQIEAWTVTALGMAVVFCGLLLCVVFIKAFGRLGQRITWGEGGEAHGAGAAPSAVAVAVAAPSEPVPADVLAVITAVLQVERKLYLNKPESRLTIRRPAP